MTKLLLFSPILAVLVLPVLAARDACPARGLRRALLQLALFNLFYLFVVLYVTPRP